MQSSASSGPCVWRGCAAASAEALCARSEAVLGGALAGRFQSGRPPCRPGDSAYSCFFMAEYKNSMAQKGRIVKKKPHTGLKKRGAAAGGHPGASRIRGLGGAVRAAGTPAGGGAPRSVPVPRRNLRPPHRRIPFAPGSGGQEAACPRFPQKKPRHFHAGAAGHSIISGMPSPSMSR